MSSKEEKDNKSSNDKQNDKSEQNTSQGNQDGSEEKDGEGGSEENEGEGEDSKDPSSSGGRNITGPEKFVAVGGSGGAAVQKDHGVEAMIHH